MMKRIATLLLTMTLAACSVGKVGAPQTLYDLGSDDRAAASLAARKPIALSFSSVPVLTGTGMIWRVGDSASPKAYTQARWSAAPADLVKQRLTERLLRQGPVLADGAPGLPHLRVTLARFEQVFAADGASSSAQVTLQAVLLQDGQVVSQKLVQRSAPAVTQDAEGGARALRQDTDDAADDLAAWLAGALH